jgi:hypothetical protein
MMEIARLYLENGKVKVLLSSKNTEDILAKLINNIESVWKDLQSTRGKGVDATDADGVALNVAVELHINIATKQRLHELLEKPQESAPQKDERSQEVQPVLEASSSTTPPAPPSKSESSVMAPEEQFPMAPGGRRKARHNRSLGRSGRGKGLFDS